MPMKDEIDHANPFEAFRRLVYLHNVPKLAPQMGMKPGTLYNKADADAESHNQPTLRDVVALTRLTGDTRVLDALNEMFDRAAFDVAPHSAASDEALLELLLTLGNESGEFHGAVRQALASKRFGRADLQRIRGEAFDMVSALMTLTTRLEGLVDD
jgi:hypothetical protein